MSNSEVLELLRNVRFFEGSSPTELDQLASVSRIETFPQGKAIFHAGENVPHIYIVVDGSVCLELATAQGNRCLYTVGAGDLLGWSPLLNQNRMTATARPVSPVRVIALDANQILTMCAYDPRFGYELMRRTLAAVANRLAAIRLQLLDVYRNELPTTADT